MAARDNFEQKIDQEGRYRDFYVERWDGDLTCLTERYPHDVSRAHFEGVSVGSRWATRGRSRF